MNQRIAKMTQSVLWFFSLALTLSLVHAKEGALASKRPNVIFVFSDDQRYDSLSMTGDPVNQTPNLDALAAEGVFFNHCYITSPICGPSRANIFTGQWERKNRIGFNSVSGNIISEETFKKSFLYKMREAGYSTAFIGKHHTKIVDSKEEVLKESVDFCYYAKGHLGFHPAKKHKTFRNAKNKSQIEVIFEATEAFLKPTKDTDYFFEGMDQSLGMSLKRRDPAKPFCAWVNFNLPHQSSLGGMGTGEGDPEFYADLYQNKRELLPLPRGYPLECNLPKDVFDPNELPGYYRLGGKGMIDTKLKTARGVYGVDQFMGNLRVLLQDLGEEDNTIIIFSSDNGLMYGEQGMSGKSMLYEDSVHVPLIVYSPSLSKGQTGKRLDHLVVGQDIPCDYS